MPSRDLRLRRHLGLPLWKVPLVARYMRERMAREIGSIAPFRGVEAMLEQLARAGTTLAVVSSNSEENIRRVLGSRHAGLIRHYEGGASLFGKRARLRRVLRTCGVPAGEAICIGDEIRDLQAARAEGIPFGAVAWGYTRLDALLAHAPEQVFREVDEISRKLGIERAIRFYERWGFEAVGSHVFRLGSDAQTDRIMMRSVRHPGLPFRPFAHGSATRSASPPARAAVRSSRSGRSPPPPEAMPEDSGRTFEISATHRIPAPADAVYGVFADYREAHPRVLPPSFFVGLHVEEGGYGAGTVIRVEGRFAGQTRAMRGIVTEPEPGRLLVESYPETRMVTSFRVVPEPGGEASTVTISTVMPRRPGLPGWIEERLVRRLLRRVYAEELHRVVEYLDGRRDG